MIRVERVTGALPAAFEAMRGEARAEGFGMLDVLAAEWISGKNRFDGDGEALIAAYCNGALAGIGGLTHDPYAAGALRMRRFYVRAAYRRNGVGGAIARALLAQPDTAAHPVTTSAAPGSEAFWEALGFVPDRRDRRTHALDRRRMD
jgi:GNAT superfamily N-acetyltransferase